MTCTRIQCHPQVGKQPSTCTHTHTHDARLWLTVYTVCVCVCGSCMPGVCVCVCVCVCHTGLGPFQHKGGQRLLEWQQTVSKQQGPGYGTSSPTPSSPMDTWTRALSTSPVAATNRNSPHDAPWCIPTGPQDDHGSEDSSPHSSAYTPYKPRNRFRSAPGVTHTCGGDALIEATLEKHAASPVARMPAGSAFASPTLRPAYKTETSRRRLQTTAESDVVASSSVVNLSKRLSSSWAAPAAAHASEPSRRRSQRSEDGRAADADADAKKVASTQGPIEPARSRLQRRQSTTPSVSTEASTVPMREPASDGFLTQIIEHDGGGSDMETGTRTSPQPQILNAARMTMRRRSAGASVEDIAQATATGRCAGPALAGMSAAMVADRLTEILSLSADPLVGTSSGGASGGGARQQGGGVGVASGAGSSGGGSGPVARPHPTRRRSLTVVMGTVGSSPSMSQSSQQSCTLGPQEHQSPTLTRAATLNNRMAASLLQRARVSGAHSGMRTATFQSVRTLADMGKLICVCVCVCLCVHPCSLVRLTMRLIHPIRRSYLCSRPSNKHSSRLVDSRCVEAL